MDPIEAPNPSDKHPANDRILTTLSALERAQWDESRPRETIRNFLRKVCESFDWKIGLLWRIDDHSNTLRQVDCWCDSSDALARFGAVSARAVFAEGVGFGWRIWHSGQLAWVPNLVDDAGFIRSRAAADAGLHTVAGFPLRNADHVVGILELYSDKIREPDKQLLDAMDVLGRQIGPFIGQASTESRWHEYSEEFFEPERPQGREANGYDQAAETLQAIYRRLSEVQENERRRLASQLHDQVGQSLTVLNLNLGLIKNQLSAEASTEGRAQLEDCLKLVEDIAENIRNVMTELHPAVLNSHGLLAALRWSAEQFQKRTAIPTAVTGEEPVPRLPATVELALFRVAQESLSNLAKYARASSAAITLEAGARFVRLTTTDNGIGFDACAIPQLGEEHGWGIQIMRERLTAVGGRLYVESVPGRGTRVIAEVSR